MEMTKSSLKSDFEKEKENKLKRRQSSVFVKEELEKIDHIEKRCCDAVRTSCQKFVEAPSIQVLMMIVTFYSLFCDDIRLMYFTKAHDYDWMYATSVAMGLFAIEIILASIG
jgi:hypothetical protein